MADRPGRRGSVRVEVVPSILSADAGRLAEQVREAEAAGADLVNVMTVEPGFGGQKFIPGSPEKIRRVRSLSADVEIEVDGGIDARTAPPVVAAGATVLVAGSSVFGYKGGIAAGIKAIRDAFD